ncbi:transposase [Sinorhizobium meliloti]|uniref:transposase n=1 Tax=Rhizobium meliloti TaxID=382 RepID=UPI00307DE4B5
MAEALEQGAGVSAIAHRLGIHPSQLFGWRRAVLDARTVSTEPARCQVVAASAGEALIEIVIGDVIVRARADVSEEHLQRERSAKAFSLGREADIIGRVSSRRP